ncbi:inositol polyphosphate kinase [Toxoplasma gondii RUB]|uniref:Inositol polyphosphate kinase n=1 Tax=Toxoplasma gondii RUB TaxID=935652 RepID=A0A086LVE7_TOXGO|nr:inositol polyphosphate kinase [Toxoplasma gondii RUB]
MSEELESSSGHQREEVLFRPRNISDSRTCSSRRVEILDSRISEPREEEKTEKASKRRLLQTGEAKFFSAPKLPRHGDSAVSEHPDEEGRTVSKETRNPEGLRLTQPGRATVQTSEKAYRSRAQFLAAEAAGTPEGLSGVCTARQQEPAEAGRVLRSGDAHDYSPRSAPAHVDMDRRRRQEGEKWLDSSDSASNFESAVSRKRLLSKPGHPCFSDVHPSPPQEQSRSHASRAAHAEPSSGPDSASELPVSTVVEKVRGPRSTAPTVEPEAETSVLPAPPCVSPPLPLPSPPPSPPHLPRTTVRCMHLSLRGAAACPSSVSGHPTPREEKRLAPPRGRKMAFREDSAGDAALISSRDRRRLGLGGTRKLRRSASIEETRGPASRARQPRPGDKVEGDEGIGRDRSKAAKTRRRICRRAAVESLREETHRPASRREKGDSLGLFAGKLEAPTDFMSSATSTQGVNRTTMEVETLPGEAETGRTHEETLQEDTETGVDSAEREGQNPDRSVGEMHADPWGGKASELPVPAAPAEDDEGPKPPGVSPLHARLAGPPAKMSLSQRRGSSASETSGRDAVSGHLVGSDHLAAVRLSSSDAFGVGDADSFVCLPEASSSVSVAASCPSPSKAESATSSSSPSSSSSSSAASCSASVSSTFAPGNPSFAAVSVSSSVAPPLAFSPGAVHAPVERRDAAAPVSALVGEGEAPASSVSHLSPVSPSFSGRVSPFALCGRRLFSLLERHAEDGRPLSPRGDTGASKGGREASLTDAEGERQPEARDELVHGDAGREETHILLKKEEKMREITEERGRSPEARERWGTPGRQGEGATVASAEDSRRDKDAWKSRNSGDYVGEAKEKKTRDGDRKEDQNASDDAGEKRHVKGTPNTAGENRREGDEREERRTVGDGARRQQMETRAGLPSREEGLVARMTEREETGIDDQALERNSKEKKQACEGKSGEGLTKVARGANGATLFGDKETLQEGREKETRTASTQTEAFGSAVHDNGDAGSLRLGEKVENGSESVDIKGDEGEAREVESERSPQFQLRGETEAKGVDGQVSYHERAQTSSTGDTLQNAAVCTPVKDQGEQRDRPSASRLVTPETEIRRQVERGESAGREDKGREENEDKKDREDLRRGRRGKEVVFGDGKETKEHEAVRRRDDRRLHEEKKEQESQRRESPRLSPSVPVRGGPSHESNSPRQVAFPLVPATLSPALSPSLSPSLPPFFLSAPLATCPASSPLTAAPVGVALSRRLPSSELHPELPVGLHALGEGDASSRETRNDECPFVPTAFFRRSLSAPNLRRLNDGHPASVSFCDWMGFPAVLYAVKAHHRHWLQSFLGCLTDSELSESSDFDSDSESDEDGFLNAREAREEDLAGAAEVAVETTAGEAGAFSSPGSEGDRRRDQQRGATDAEFSSSFSSGDEDEALFPRAAASHDDTGYDAGDDVAKAHGKAAPVAQKTRCTYAASGVCTAQKTRHRQGRSLRAFVSSSDSEDERRLPSGSDLSGGFGGFRRLQRPGPSRRPAAADAGQRRGRRQRGEARCRRGDSSELSRQSSLGSSEETPLARVSDEQDEDREAEGQGRAAPAGRSRGPESRGEDPQRAEGDGRHDGLKERQLGQRTPLAGEKDRGEEGSLQESRDSGGKESRRACRGERREKRGGPGASSDSRGDRGRLGREQARLRRRADASREEPGRRGESEGGTRTEGENKVPGERSHGQNSWEETRCDGRETASRGRNEPSFETRRFAVDPRLVSSPSRWWMYTSTPWLRPSSPSHGVHAPGFFCSRVAPFLSSARRHLTLLPLRRLFSPTAFAGLGTQRPTAFSVSPPSMPQAHAGPHEYPLFLPVPSFAFPEGSARSRHSGEETAVDLSRGGDSAAREQLSPALSSSPFPLFEFAANTARGATSGDKKPPNLTFRFLPQGAHGAQDSTDPRPGGPGDAGDCGVRLSRRLRRRRRDGARRQHGRLRGREAARVKAYRQPLVGSLPPVPRRHSVSSFPHEVLLSSAAVPADPFAVAFDPRFPAEPGLSYWLSPLAAATPTSLETHGGASRLFAETVRASETGKASGDKQVEPRERGTPVASQAAAEAPRPASCCANLSRTSWRDGEKEPDEALRSEKSTEIRKTDQGGGVGGSCASRVPRLETSTQPSERDAAVASVGWPALALGVDSLRVGLGFGLGVRQETAVHAAREQVWAEPGDSQGPSCGVGLPSSTEADDKREAGVYDV